jgi:hypothetical protein
LSVVNEVDGKKVDLFGPNPQEQFIFTPDGYFSINIIRSGRTKFTATTARLALPRKTKRRWPELSVFLAHTPSIPTAGKRFMLSAAASPIGMLLNKNASFRSRAMR